jgi:hypothetical protein
MHALTITLFLVTSFFMKNVQVLTNGIEVKLHRNALSVIEPLTGLEEDDDLEFENTIWHESDMGEFQFGMLLFFFCSYLSKFLFFTSF